MNKLPVSIVIALALSTTLGFACGYLFYAAFGEARAAAAQAVWDARETQRVLQAYSPIVITSRFHAELVAAKTPQDLDVLRQNYRDATLRNISSFERQAGQLELLKDRALAESFLKEAAKIRRELEAKKP